MNAFVAPYSPTPGSVAFKAIAFLERQPRGTELMSSKLAESIGVSPACIGASLEAAKKYGAIFGRKKIDTVRAPVFWSLVDHDSEPAPVVPPPASFPPKLVQSVDIDAVHLRRDRVIEMESAAPTPTLADVAESAGMQEAGDARPHQGREAARAPIPDRRVTEEQRHADKRRASAPDGMRIALWSDGTFEINRRGELIEFSVDETRQILRYLERLGEASE